MKVLIACEFSGTVRDAFTKAGHEATSCDLLPTEKRGRHYMGDVRDILNDGWDLMIAHPPCTFLAVSANKWYKPEFKERFPTRHEDRKKAIEFFMLLANCKIPKYCIENPIGIMSTVYKKPTQVIQPWMYGHGETKATCLWLRGLPRLNGFNAVEGREQRLHKLPPSEERWKERSRTFYGIAKAMAEQWGKININQKVA